MAIDQITVPYEAWMRAWNGDLFRVAWAFTRDQNGPVMPLAHPFVSGHHTPDWPYDMGCVGEIPERYVTKASVPIPDWVKDCCFVGEDLWWKSGWPEDTPGVILVDQWAEACEDIMPVTSVGLDMPPEFVVANSPIVGSGTFIVSKVDQLAGTFYAGPESGTAGSPLFRTISVSDLPSGYPAGDLDPGVLPPGVTIPPDQIDSGVLPPGVTIPPDQIDSGVLPPGVTIPPDQIDSGVIPPGVTIPPDQIDSGVLPPGVTIPPDQIDSGVIPPGVTIAADQLDPGVIPPGVTIAADQLDPGTIPAGVDIPYSQVTGGPAANAGVSLVDFPGTTTSTFAAAGTISNAGGMHGWASLENTGAVNMQWRLAWNDIYGGSYTSGTQTLGPGFVQMDLTKAGLAPGIEPAVSITLEVRWPPAGSATTFEWHVSQIR